MGTNKNSVSFRLIGIWVQCLDMHVNLTRDYFIKESFTLSVSPSFAKHKWVWIKRSCNLNRFLLPYASAILTELFVYNNISQTYWSQDPFILLKIVEDSQRAFVNVVDICQYLACYKFKERY